MALMNHSSSLLLRTIYIPRALSSVHVSILSNNSVKSQQKRQLTGSSTNHLTATMDHPAEFNINILKKVFDLICKEGLISDNYDSRKKVVEFVPPAELGERLGGLTIEKEGVEDIDNLIEAVVKYSVKTCHANFHNQLYAGSDAAALAGQWLSDALNTNAHTFEVAPVFLIVERALIEYTIRKLGWSQGGDGITAPGGSLANMYGLMLARHNLYPDIKTKGIASTQTKPLAIFTSEDSHYSVLKGANWMGIGTDNVLKVKTDYAGRMIPSELKKSIQMAIDDGKVPLAVNATSGTTVLGAYDDLSSLAEVCQAFSPKIWLHVDACWGGSAILSPKLQFLMKGAEHVDSLAWNPHKMIGAPLQSNIFVTQKSGLLAQCNSASATYLFQQDKFYDVSYDTGDKSVQCGRKTDAFQVWFMLKTRGERYFSEGVENAFAQAEYLAKEVREREGFELVLDPHSCTNVCFRYIPKSMRTLERDHQFWQNLSQVPPKIKEKLTIDGTLMIGYQPLPHKNLSNFFRMVVHAIPHPTKVSMDHVLDEIQRCGDLL